MTEDALDHIRVVRAELARAIELIDRETPRLVPYLTGEKRSPFKVGVGIVRKVGEILDFVQKQNEYFVS